MRIVNKIFNTLSDLKASRIIKYLEKADPKQMIKRSEKKVIKSFKTAAKHQSCYREFLEKKDINLKKIISLKSFKKMIPIIDKSFYFNGNDFKNICIRGKINKSDKFLVSSGFTNDHSYTIETKKENKETIFFNSYFLPKIFKVDTENVFFINCTSMGTEIPINNFPQAVVGTRLSAAISLIKKVTRTYKRIGLIGELLFLKRLVEEGIKCGINWHNYIIHMVVGGEYIPEGYRDYLAHLLGIDLGDLNTGSISFNMGLTEFSLSLFKEMPYTIELRRYAYNNARFRKALTGNMVKACPQIMCYFPQKYFMETLLDKDGDPQLVVSTLDKKRNIPLIRYNTYDFIKLITQEELNTILSKFNFKLKAPVLRLPIGLIWGRKQRIKFENGDWISPNEIHEALFMDKNISAKITGNYKILQKTARKNKNVKLLVQLNENETITKYQNNKFHKYLNNYIKVDITTEFIPFRLFPYGFEHDFNKKNRYI